MRQTLVAIVLALAAASCADTSDRPVTTRPEPVTFEDLVSNPGDFDGRTIETTSGYLSSFEVSVLTSGFAESYPPQATDPQIWVDGSAPTGDCVERARGTTWAERVVATGAFTYRADGGLGHLGAYDMALEDATLACR